LIELGSTFYGATASSGPGLSHYQYFTITLRHTTLLWTSDQPDWGEKQPFHQCNSNPQSQWPQKHALDWAATGIG